MLLPASTPGSTSFLFLSPSLSIYIYTCVCVYIHVYIFFCLFSSRSFFSFLLFSFYPLLLSPYPLEIFFSSHVLSLKKVHRLSLSLSLSGIFVSIHQFVSQIDRFFLLLSFLYQDSLKGIIFPLSSSFLPSSWFFLSIDSTRSEWFLRFLL